ncbi:TIGR04282 family arsenosugar biosynthesis glycosyltransferase [Parapedobacter tibetensis]|uniref:TIGR04282 family arsenosugar biosynthesis glycosyltransferase n=1 Tax=Parapedobacter tibetensis TaxID=2972951 RepID=UPI00214D283E|nr:TIGR04282 family arsenosugar biosynthesis glycosyltransferase [Parapedobacter tibetensis]
MKQQNMLMIFAKNLIHGKVKTRLAASIGPSAAFEVYKELLQFTTEIARKTTVDKIIFYSEQIPPNDGWSDDFAKAIQQGADLGERMKNAFKAVFQQGYTKAVIIGTDCPMITEAIIVDAFDRLEKNDVVIGPAHDGGYYLLGLKALHEALFDHIQWSTSVVLDETIVSCINNNLSYSLLPVLHDIDEERDLVHLKALKG